MWRADLAGFRTWEQVMAWIEENPEQAPDIAQKVRLVDRHSAEKIQRLLKEIVPESSAEVTISTVHQAKGREWRSVKIANDFPHPDDMEEAELRVGYVAVTRARNNLNGGRLLDHSGKRSTQRCSEDTIHLRDASQPSDTTGHESAAGAGDTTGGDPQVNESYHPLVAGVRVHCPRAGDGVIQSISGWGDSAWCLILLDSGEELSLPARALTRVVPAA